MYKITKVYFDYIDRYFENVCDEDIKYFDLDYNKKIIKRKPYFMFNLEKENNNSFTEVGLFGMFLMTRDISQTFFLHLKSSERGKGIGYFLQYLRLFLVKNIFPTVKYVITMCDCKATRALKLYDNIYRISNNKKKNIKAMQTKIKNYITYKRLLDNLINIDNDIVNFIKKDNNKLITNILVNNGKLLDLTLLNKNKNS